MPLSRHEEQNDRLEVLENEKRLREQGSTFLSHTHNDIGGRFAAISSPVVVGEKQIPQYPAAFLQHDPVPDEPALGVDVNALEPCGEPHELRASIASLGPSLPPSAQETPDPAPGPPLAAKRAGSALFRRK